MRRHDDAVDAILRASGSELMSVERDRFTSRSRAAARFIAQRGLLKPLVWSLCEVRVEGREHLEKVQGPFVLVANHSSHLDAPLLIGALPRRLSRYLATGAAADYFFDVVWRRVLTVLFFNAFPIERSGSSSRAGITRKLLDRGIPVLVFPEGTRSRTGEMGAFKQGAAALAIAEDVPCLPVAIIGAYDAMPKGRNWPLPGRPVVRVVFGPPLTAMPGDTPQKLTGRMSSLIRSLKNGHGTADGITRPR
jgi:1-acyl-sn-glycerol-3-phosphate acyltransferase